MEPLLLQPLEGKVRLMSPKAGKRILVSSEVAQLVLAAQRGIAKAGGGQSIGWTQERYCAVTQKLAGYGYLVDGTEESQLPAPWCDWGPVAWAYHTSLTDPSALDVPVRLAPPEDTANRPSSFRDLGDAPVLLLPRLSPRSTMRFIDVLERRRTHRHFAPVAISLDELSDLLRYTFGPLRFVDAGPLGVMQLRAAASGGARHETDAYVYIFNVDSVEPGLYLYDSLRHGLVAVRPGLLRDELDCLTFERCPSQDAAFAVVTVAQSERMSWKYRYSSAYRVLWQNVGCLAQVFSMVCASLGLGASMTGAIRVAEARSALGVPSPSELVTFVMCCGRPVLRDDGLPASVAMPTVPFRP